MRIRPPAFVVPVILAGTMLLAAASSAVVAAGTAAQATLSAAAQAAAPAAGNVTETAAATYEVVPAQNLIQVTVQVSIRNSRPSQAFSSGTITYSRNSTEIAIEQAAGPILASANVGAVVQSAVGGDARYRLVKLNFTNVYYGQTRVVTAKYAIPGAPTATGPYQANGAYAALCAVGNGHDSGTVSVVIPDGYDLQVDNGGQLTKTGEAGGKQVYSSGVQADPKGYWTCVAARNKSNVSHSPMSASGQAFDIQGWPGDATWAAMVNANLGPEIQRLKDLTGLSLPGGTIVIAEVGNGKLNDHGLGYDPATKTVTVPQSANPAMLAHALSHIWFNSTLLKDRWLYEGLATYGERGAGEGNYAACDKAPAYPGTGAPNLTTWRALNPNSSIQDQNVSDWQYAAACSFVSAAAKAMGPANFRNVLTAALTGESPYGAAGSKLPLTTQQFLDIIDELGMVPGGVADLGVTQRLLTGLDILDPATLAARLDSRTAYHALEARAGTWKIPPLVGRSMNVWDFPAAQKEMARITEILDARELANHQLTGFSVDGTAIQTQFESAATQADLDNVLALTTRMSDAAAKVAHAVVVRSGSRDFLQSIGLNGVDLDTPLNLARKDLAKIDPDGAEAKAKSVIDRVDGARDLGLLWVLAAVAGVAFVLILLALLVWFVVLPIRRRLKSKAAVPADNGIGKNP